jgi:predicted phage tail protein
MKKVILKGALSKDFGDQFELDVSSPAEAVRALCYQIEGFETALQEGSYRVEKLYANTNSSIYADELSLAFGSAYGLQITPVIKGAKNKSLGKIILGGALIAGAFMLAGPAAVAANGAITGGMGATAGFGITYGNIAMLGATMALQGVSAMLSPQIATPETAEQNASFLIDSTGNKVEQGNPIPVIFGEVWTGSIVVSAGISTENMPVDQSN